MKPYIDKGDYWDAISDQERLACYNGMGAEWMSKTSRVMLDIIFSSLDDGVRIHDVDFCYSPKTKESWHNANYRMKRNFILLAKNEIPWYRALKRRRFLRLWIPLLFECVESDGGWKAFLEAKPPSIHLQPRKK